MLYILVDNAVAMQVLHASQDRAKDKNEMDVLCCYHWGENEDNDKEGVAVDQGYQA